MTGVICSCAFLKQFFVSVGITELIYLMSCHLQIICSCCFLYLLRRLKLISFHLSESLATPDNFKTFVPLKTVIDTLPVAVTYLLYMVIASFSIALLCLLFPQRSGVRISSKDFMWSLVLLES